MCVRRHSQATTTPKIPAAIQARDEPAWVLADRHATAAQTVWKWRKRDSVQDRSQTPHRRQPPHRHQPALTPVQEIVAVDLRETLLWSLDDPMAVVREFLNPTMSRLGLDPCLRRHGAGRLRDRKAKDGTPKHSGLKPYGLGHLHIDVKYPPCMANETSRGYFFVTIDRASRWVFIAMYRHKTAATAQRFLGDLERACPIRSRTILTGMERWSCLFDHFAARLR